MTGAVVVTGLGIVSPAGLGVRDYWAQTCGGKYGQVRTGAPGESPRPGAALAVPGGADPLWGRPQADRMARLTLAAADWALADAGIRPQDLPDLGPDAVTAVTAAAVAATGSAGRAGAGSWPGFGAGPRPAPGGAAGGPWTAAGRHGGGYRSFAWFYAVSSGQISIRDGMKGLDAVAHARRQIRQGSRLIVSGGVDAPLCPAGWPGQGPVPGGAACESGDGQPAPSRRGGGALLVLEDAVAALDREAKIYGEVAGYGATFDPDPDGGRERGLRRAVELALADAWALPGEVDAVFVPGLDAAEAAAVTAVLGLQGVPVTAPRTMTGRRYHGAAAPLGLAAALLAMDEGLIPPTADVTPFAGHDLNVVLSPRTAELRTTVVLGRGHGGFNSAVVLRAVY
ncbi:beta-ketoacyl synthase N-terminal-like domain-containing protein [Streptomyces sp. CA-111067]|uniref:beta-ketoacyl synthase N-terminal-like domain-containing protein n=1 Tax=Streptomyces sp. CA-111067 TaxID=3240046 RepID=UPI003D97B06D